mgnify:FL=1
MATFTTTRETASSSGEQNTNYAFALTSLTTLFFMWGFITCLNDILIPHLKNVFALNYTQAMLIQFCFFGAYFIVSLPAGRLVKRIGYKRGIVYGLSITALGCALFYPAAALQRYELFLGALFVLASGITLLQVAANPYVTALGKKETAASRLNMTQAFNALGTTVAPYLGALLILSGVVADASQMTDAQRLAEAQAVQFPYIMLSVALLVLAIIFSALKLPTIETIEQSPSKQQTQGSAWQHSHLVLGALAIFVYVGAEVSIGSFLINFLGEDHIMGFNESQAAKYIGWYWGGAMVGRFAGAIVMQKIAAGKVLAFNATLATMLILIAVFAQGSLAMWAILLVGLCNSIMFPTIFSLGLAQLGHLTSQGSGILCLAIVGGALIPLLQGVLADSIGVQLAFLLPSFCYLYIAYYGLKGSIVKTTV